MGVSTSSAPQLASVRSLGTFSGSHAGTGGLVTIGTITIPQLNKNQYLMISAGFHHTAGAGTVSQKITSASDILNLADNTQEYGLAFIYPSGMTGQTPYMRVQQDTLAGARIGQDFYDASNTATCTLNVQVGSTVSYDFNISVVG